MDRHTAETIAVAGALAIGVVALALTVWFITGALLQRLSAVIAL